jgi:hypothetical protein
LCDSDRLEKVGRAARKRVTEHHDWRTVLPAWHRAIEV